MKSKSGTQKGFTIIEVVFFMTILSIVLLTMTGYVIRLLFTMKINEHKIQANIYAEEAKEWLNGEHETDWNIFLSRATNTYCLNNPITPTFTFPAPGACTNFNGIVGSVAVPAIYRREVTLTRDGPGNTVRALITVRWMEGTTQYQDRLEAYYTRW